MLIFLQVSGVKSVIGIYCVHVLSSDIIIDT